MKPTIIFLGLALLTGINTKANNVVAQELTQQEVATVVVALKSTSEIAVEDRKTATIIEADNTGDTAVFSPDTVLKSSNVKSTEAVIANDKLVTEATEDVYQPLCIEMSLLDTIQEANQIIESTITDEVFPLDFEKINRTVQCVKSNINHTALPVDIKL